MTTTHLATAPECDRRMTHAAVDFDISLCIMEVSSGVYPLCFAACGIQLLSIKGSCSFHLHARTIVGFAGNTGRYFSSSCVGAFFMAVLVWALFACDKSTSLVSTSIPFPGVVPRLSPDAVWSCRV